MQLYWQGTGSYFFTPEHEAIIADLEKILLLPIGHGDVYRNIKRAERHYKQQQIAHDITFEQLSKLEERFPNHPNLYIKTDFQRMYPHGSLASHIVGYLGNSIDHQLHGKMGLEQICEQYLKGQQGLILATVNSVGRTLTQKEIQAAQEGQHIQTTIDIPLQKLCERVFPEEYAGAMIIMHPTKGDILAVVSRPIFNPTLFLSPIKREHWDTMQLDQPFINRAFNASYPPGSIFKLITVSAALEHDIITPQSTWHCNGFITYANRRVWCHNKHGHGILSTLQAVAHSCNIICYDIGKKIDVDILAHYARMFGLGQKTNIPFPEQAGLVPTRGWKRAMHRQPWWPGETLSVSIGQSFLLVTPIQVAAMISSIFTGSLPTPRILIAEPIQHKPLPITPETRTVLQESMRLVVTTGTGKQVNTIKDYTIFAKTSTAQTSSLDKRSLGNKYLEHGWFVAYIQYKDTPPLTIVIIAEHSGTSKAATTIAKNFLLEYKKKIDQDGHIVS